MARVKATQTTSVPTPKSSSKTAPAKPPSKKSPVVAERQPVEKPVVKKTKAKPKPKPEPVVEIEISLSSHSDASDETEKVVVQKPKVVRKKAVKKVVVPVEESEETDENQPTVSDSQAPSESASGSDAQTVVKSPKEREYELVPGSIQPMNDDSPALDKPIHKNDHGCYKSKTPSLAASKAFTRICKVAEVKEASYKFAIREKKKADAVPKYYIGSRTKLDEPRKIPTGPGSGYTVNYKSRVHVWKNRDSDE